MDPIKKIALIEAAASKLTELINSGEFSEGDKLPSERELSAKLKISRAAVQEALIVLQALGRIEIKRDLGAFVAGTDKDSSESATLWFSEHVLQLGDYMEARQVIESSAAGLACQRARESEISQLEQIHQKFETAVEKGDVVGIVEADKAFHSAIIKATHNRVFSIINHRLERAFEKYRIKSFSIRDSRTRSLLQHRGILQALKSRDPGKAQEEMTHHLDVAHTQMISFREEESSQT